MPNPRRKVQEAHERFQVGLLLDTLNHRHRSDFKVIEEPNPPEAIIQSRSTLRWVEVVTAFWNSAFAKDVYSFATEGEKHASVGNGAFMNMDQEFACSFADAVQAKLEKSTYESIRDSYGLGYLLVSVQFPFFSDDTYVYIRNEWRKRQINDRGCFRAVYLTHRIYEGYKVKRWTP